MQIEFEKWITQIIKTEKPSKKIKGYYFGIFETGEKEYMMYLSGSKEFDEEDEDWACSNDFEPKNKYLALPFYKDLKWEDVLEKVVATLKNFIISTMYKNSFFTKAKAIATGFDDGDLVLLVKNPVATRL